MAPAAAPQAFIVTLVLSFAYAMELCDGKSEKASEGMPLPDGGISDCIGEGACAEEPQLSEGSTEDSHISLGTGEEEHQLSDGRRRLPNVSSGQWRQRWGCCSRLTGRHAFQRATPPPPRIQEAIPAVA